MVCPFARFEMFIKCVFSIFLFIWENFLGEWYWLVFHQLPNFWNFNGAKICSCWLNHVWLHVMALTLCFIHVSSCTMWPCISCMPYTVRYRLLALPQRLELVPRHGRKGRRFSPVVLCRRFFQLAAMARQSFYLLQPLLNNSCLWCSLSGWPAAWPCY